MVVVVVGEGVFVCIGCLCVCGRGRDKQIVMFDSAFRHTRFILPMIMFHKQIQNYFSLL